jgi:hypothetical protein
MKRLLSIYLALTQVLWGLPWLVAAVQSPCGTKSPLSCCCDEAGACCATAEETAPCRPGAPSRGTPTSPCCTCYLPNARVRIVARAERTSPERAASSSATIARSARSLALVRPSHAIPMPVAASTRRALLCIWTT